MRLHAFQHTPHDGEGHEPEVHHHKPGQITKRLESYVSIAMAIVAALLLVIVGYAIIGTGPQTPPWMH
jgi:hypothetical protein